MTENAIVSIDDDYIDSRDVTKRIASLREKFENGLSDNETWELGEERAMWERLRDAYPDRAAFDEGVIFIRDMRTCAEDDIEDEYGSDALTRWPFTALDMDVAVYQLVTGSYWTFTVTDPMGTDHELWTRR